MAAAFYFLFLASTAVAGTILVGDSSGQLGYVNTDGTVTTIGSVTGVVDPLSDDQLTDIAFDNAGGLWGLSFSNFYSIDVNTYKATLVGSGGSFGTYLNALVFSDSGEAYAMGPSNRQLYSIDTSTGVAIALGNTGYKSGGDLAFFGNDLFFASDKDELIKVDTATAAGTKIGDIGYSLVWGLAEVAGELFGVAGTDLFVIDTLTGLGGLAESFFGQGLNAAWGATSVIPIPPALLLFGSALAGIALVGRRKKPKGSSEEKQEAGV